MKVFYPSIFPLLFFFSSCQIDIKNNEADLETPRDFDPDSIKSYIMDQNKKFCQAHIDGDTAFLNAIFHSEARGFPPGFKMIIGSREIAAVNSEFVEYGIYRFEETTTRFYGTSEYLIDEGTYVMVYGEERVEEVGKYLNVWKPENEEWKLYANIWNTND